MRLTYAVIEITNACNLRCKHCASTSGKAREHELSFLEVTTLLRDIRSLGGEEITIIGGEALLRNDWFDICREVTRLGMRLILISNGINITSAVRNQLMELTPHIIGISLDGADRESYRSIRGLDKFDFTMNLLENLAADGHANVNAITTFTRHNLRQFNNFADLFDGTNIIWQVQLANHGGQRFDDSQFITKEDYAFFVQQMTHAYQHRPGLLLRHMDDFGYYPMDPSLKFLHQCWNGCLAGRSLIGVRSNGDVMGCLSLGDGFEEANIRLVSLEEIWTSNSYFERFRKKQKYLYGTCKTCSAAATCMGGCTSIAYSATGSIGNNPYCIRTIENQKILTDLLNS